MQKGLFQVLPQERHDLKPVVIHPRFFAQCVVAAWDLYLAVFYLVAVEGVDGVAREVDGKAEVVEAVDVTLRTRREV